ncbi:hypothetical protein F4779DRAFT_565566 [Xylariaceae sp. FL0662B]|nr:hypothetical protein F4779DRAFT_565566 [Xylariaceae sp. FL0662B]
MGETGQRGALIDGVIDRMLKEKPSRDDGNWDNEQREQLDFWAIQNVHLEFHSGDTLVLVNFPPSFINCAGDMWTSKRFLVDSEKLLGTGSRVFRNLLSPKEQARFRKRLERMGEVVLEGFVIDLTPSTEGDELAAQLIELSLPAGVREWWTTKERLGVSPYLVSGHDDHCPCHATVFNDSRKVDGYIVLPNSGNTADLPRIDLADLILPKARVIDDYCPVRHRANIIRLLLAIQGQDLVLNSAARVYTLTGVAKILDCTNAIRDPVLMWLMAEPNSDFIDIHPDHALKIAWTLQLPTVTRAAFRILVAENAIESLCSNRQGGQYTIFGRPRADLPDDMQTVIQYAALKYADRAQQTLARLTSDRVCDLLDITEHRKLARVEHFIKIASSGGPNPTHAMNGDEDLRHLAAAVSNKLSQYIAQLVRNVVRDPPSGSEAESIDHDRRCYVPRGRWTSAVEVYDALPDAARLLTSCFWENLNASLAEMQDIGDRMLDDVRRFNKKMVIMNRNACPRVPELMKMGTDDALFDLDAFFRQLRASVLALGGRFFSKGKTELEAPLHRTRHLTLDLSDEEFQYLPLWAGGLDDGTGGVFGTAVPDADLGPAGPGPTYHTGDSVATDISSIRPSDPTASLSETATMTAGRSLAVGRSDVVSGADAAARVVSAPSGDDSLALSGSGYVSAEDDDQLCDDDDDDDNYELSDEAWSLVEEP